MSSFKIEARAKINLTLDVIRKREDGYHDVRMIMQTIDLYDTIYLERKIGGVSGEISIETNLPYLPVNERNIAYKAARLFFESLNLKDEGVKIVIDKKIPVAAGLAGGSTDAAAVLVAMNKIYEAGLSSEQLCEMAKQLGSDVPYCINGGTVLAEGRGEILTCLPPLPTTKIVLAKPPFSVSTPDVYGKLDVNSILNHPDTEGTINAIYNKDVIGVAKRLSNVLESITAKEHEIINRIKNIMIGNGAIGSVMSGSGPTVFGIFENEISALKAMSKLRRIVKDIFLINTYNSN